MRIAPFVPFVALMAAIVPAGCSSGTNLTCQTQTCASASKTYQTCASAGGSATYNFGGQSCTCPNGDSIQCEACANDVAAYCGSGGSSGSGGSGGGSGSTSGSSSGSGGGSSSGSGGSSGSSSGSGGSSGSSSGSDSGGSSGSGSGGSSGSSSGGTVTPCSYTVTGAVTATGSCTVTAAYDASKGSVGFAVTDSSTLNFGATLTGQTQLTDGTYTLPNAAPGAGADYLMGTTAVWVMCTTAQNCNDAKGNTIAPQGSFTLTITNPGPVTQGVLWQNPQGSLTLTLPAQPNGQATGTVTVDVTL